MRSTFDPFIRLGFRHWEWLRGKKLRLMRNHRDGVSSSNLRQTQSHLISESVCFIVQFVTEPVEHSSDVKHRQNQLRAEEADNNLFHTFIYSTYVFQMFSIINKGVLSASKV